MANTPAETEANFLVDQPFDAGNPKAVNNARKKAGREEREKLDFIEGMLSLPQGRKWLWNLMESCSIHGNPVTQNDTHATYFQLGMQNVGKLILQDVMRFPSQYVTMVTEANARK